MTTQITFTDAYDIINKKILVNKISLTNMEIQIKHSHESAQLHLLIVKNLRDKIVLVNQLNDILEKQLSLFDEDRQNDCFDIHQKINKLDEITGELKERLDKVKKYEEDMINNIYRIKCIEQTIPQTQEINNYIIKIKRDNNSWNCATDAIGINKNSDVL